MMSLVCVYALPEISEPLLTSFCYSIFGPTDDYVKPRMHCMSTNMAPHT
jgi:hypothetical protein